MKVKNAFKNMTIRRRFTVSVLTVVIITMFAFELQKIMMLVQYTKSDISQKIETTSQLAGLSFVDSIWNLNLIGIKEIGEALLQDKEIGYILVEVKGSGEVYERHKTGSAYEKKNLFIKEVEILKEDLTIGKITIGITNYYRINNLQNYIISTIFRVLVMACVLWLAINFVSRIVTKSIYELSLGTDEISNGNLTHRLAINSGDEIGELASNFNIMTQNLYNMIRERDSAIKALESSEEKFNKAFNYSADVIAIVRVEDKLYVEINESFLRIFGYKREEIIGHYSSEFNLWKDEEHHLKVLEVLDNGESLRNEEATWNAKNGETRIGLFSTAIIEINNVPCIIFVWNDITERKLADEALKRAKDELENKVSERTKQLLEILMQLERQHEKLKSTQSKLVQSEKMASLGTLVAGVAHEINNPINYSYLSSKVLNNDLVNFKKELMYLLDGTDDESMKFFEDYFKKFFDSINIILNGSNHIKTVVQDLRLFSRLDEAIKKEISISEALEITIRLVKTQYTKQIEFKTNFHTEGKIECYPSQLNQVFLNIIVNSCQAIMESQKNSKNEGKGIINIELSEKDKGILIAVNDNGCGMNAEVKQKIFEPFFTTKPVGQGTGLGMSISYGIIEKHNGNIEVQSQVGRGTTITIFIPY